MSKNKKVKLVIKLKDFIFAVLIGFFVFISSRFGVISSLAESITVSVMFLFFRVAIRGIWNK